MSFDVLPDGVIRIDVHGMIREMNEAAAELTGHSPRRQVGRSCHDVLMPRTATGRPLLEEGWGPFTRLPGVKRLSEQTVVLRCADGSDRPVRLTGNVRRDERGRFGELVASFRPVVRRVDRDGVPSGIAVISTVSHELRSPLTAVKGYTALLKNRWESFSDEDKRMMLDQISHGCDRITRLITELLEVSRLEGGRLPLQRKLADIPALVKRVVSGLQSEFPELSPVLDFPVITPRVFVDPDKIEQVITNLIENSCKYASPVGIRISGTFEEDEMTLVVEDTGPGIPKTELPRVFSKLYRAANTKPSGSGLGLWIARGIVETHGGELTVESAEDAGSRFCMRIPLGSQEDAA